MKILRSVTRRGFSVGTAGWFTVLKPNTWIAATRVSGSFHYPSVRSKGAVEGVEGRQRPMLSLIARLGPQESRVVRSLLIALAAMVITSVLLLWIMHPR